MINYKQYVTTSKSIIFILLFFIADSLIARPLRYDLPKKPELYQDLPAQIRTGTIEMRLNAIQMAGWQRVYFAVRALIENLDDPEDIIREESARYIGVLGRKIAVEPLQKAIKVEANNKVKAVMILSFASLKSYNANKYVEQFLKDDNEYIRSAAAEGLGIIKKRDSTSKLKEAVESEKNEKIKVKLYTSLILIYPNLEYKLALIKLLASENLWTRFQTAEALEMLKIREAAEPLEQALLIEEDEQVRSQISKAYWASVSNL